MDVASRVDAQALRAPPLVSPRHSRGVSDFADFSPGALGVIPPDKSETLFTEGEGRKASHGGQSLTALQFTN